MGNMDVMKIENLTKQYKGFRLDNVSLRIKPGEIVGLVGENGAGKSTLMKAALGLIRSDAGQVLFWGQPLQQNSVEIKNKIGVMLDESGFYHTMNAQEAGKICAGIYKDWDSAKYETFLNKYGINMKKPIKDYSKGMRVKLMLATALCHGAEILILDEPTSGLDPVAREEILENFKEFVSDGKKAVLISSHISSDLEKIADEIVFIHQGRQVFSKSSREICEEGGVDMIMNEYVRGKSI